jgi:hypothetical protein
VTVWKLLRILLRHALHGHGRDEVFVSIQWDTPESGGMVTGDVREFTWEGDNDRFCMIDAVCTDPIDFWFPDYARGRQP